MEHNVLTKTTTLKSELSIFSEKPIFVRNDSRRQPKLLLLI